MGGFSVAIYLSTNLSIMTLAEITHISVNSALCLSLLSLIGESSFEHGTSVDSPNPRLL